MVSNLSKVIVPKYWTYSQCHITWGWHFIHSKSEPKLGLDQTAYVVSAVSLELDFPSKCMYNNLPNHNCLFVLNCCFGFIWSTVHDYDFCFLHLSRNSLCFRTANVVLFICKKTTRNEVYLILSGETVYVFKRWLFCVFPGLRSNKGNKHQNNIRVNVYIFGHGRHISLHLYPSYGNYK